MSLLAHYRRQIETRQLRSDFRQHQVVKVLDDFAERLATSSIGKRWLFTRKQPPQSLYLYGDVGRGKTMLMDLLYHSIMVEKQRIHFGEFMLELHANLKRQQGRKNPLEYLAAQSAKKIDLLCFDEFQVIDIADAMLLGRFFGKLLDTGVALCITSNTPPSQLYADGLQRERFMPVIQRIENEFTLIPMFQGSDYRRFDLPDSSRWLQPANSGSRQQIIMQISSLQEEPHIENSVLRINHRPIKSIALFRQVGAGVFTFDDLCNTARHSADYLTLARNWPIFALINIPQLDDKKQDQTRRFIQLVDQLYEHRCACLFSADTAIENIYTGNTMRDVFARCASRLYSLQHNPLQENSR